MKFFYNNYKKTISKNLLLFIINKIIVKKFKFKDIFLKNYSLKNFLIS